MTSTNRKGTRRIISFSLYGSRPIYLTGAIRNAAFAPRFYPGWIPRFYVDDSVPADVISKLVEQQAEIVRVEAKSLGPMYGRYWRFWVAAEPEVERFIIRDADSLINSREQAAVAAWIESGKSFHIMRDSIHHRTRMLAGMWGGVGGVIPDIRALTDSWGRYSVEGQCDQFVSEVIFPRIAHDYICHDSWGHHDDGVPFPPHKLLEGTSFVGQRVGPEMDSLDVWRRLGEYDNEVRKLQDEVHELQDEVHELHDARESATRLARQLADDRRRLFIDLRLQEGPRSLRLALAIARFIRASYLWLRWW